MGDITGYLWWVVQFGGVIIVGVITALVKDWVIATFAAANSRRKRKLIDKLETDLSRLAARALFNDLLAPMIANGFRLLYSAALMIPMVIVFIFPPLYHKLGLQEEAQLPRWVFLSLSYVAGILALVISYWQTRISITLAQDTSNALAPISQLEALSAKLVKLDPTVDVSPIVALIERLRRERREAAALAGFELTATKGRLPRLPPP